MDRIPHPLKIGLAKLLRHGCHTTISNWCTRFAPMFQNTAIQLIPALNCKAFGDAAGHCE